MKICELNSLQSDHLYCAPVLLSWNIVDKGTIFMKSTLLLNYYAKFSGRRKSKYMHTYAHRYNMNFYTKSGVNKNLMLWQTPLMWS